MAKAKLGKDGEGGREAPGELYYQYLRWIRASVYLEMREEVSPSILQKEEKRALIWIKNVLIVLI